MPLNIDMSFKISCYTLFDITRTGVVNRSKPGPDDDPDRPGAVHARRVECPGGEPRARHRARHDDAGLALPRPPHRPGVRHDLPRRRRRLFPRVLHRRGRDPAAASQSGQIGRAHV